MDSQIPFVRLLLLLLALAPLGCTPVAKKAPEGRPRKAVDAPIEIFVTKLPTRPYEEIGMAHAKSPVGVNDKSFENLKYRARKLGGDAVIVRESGGTTGNAMIGGTHFVTVGVVIAWTDVAPADGVQAP